MSTEREVHSTPVADHLTKWRIYSCLFGIIFGAWLGATILVLLKLSPQVWASPSMLLVALSSSMSWGLLGMIIALPLSGFVVVLGIPFWWETRISLSKVLSVTAFGTGMLLVAELIAKGGSSKEALLVFASALASASICWRITKRWHSPELAK